MSNLTIEDQRLLESLVGGADIFSRFEAVKCRKFEMLGYVTIIREQGKYEAAKQLPYFGAITTAKGKKLIATRKELEG